MKVKRPGLETSMWAEACEMLQRAERLHRQFFRPATDAANAPSWEPPADIFESNSEVRVVIALPGVAATDIEVVAANGALTVVGRRAPPRWPREVAVRRLELPYGRFERQFSFPGRAFDAVSQELANGCLTVHLRKAR